MSDQTKLARVVGVKALADQRVEIRWAGTHRADVIDLMVTIARLKGLRPLRDRKVFTKVASGEGGHSIAWPGELDIGADTLWLLAQEQNGLPGVAAFVEWRQRHGLSLEAAATALGLSRRMVAYYCDGTRPVPRPVQLACKGWEVDANVT